ncbi:MAG: hypothetical protein HCA27_17800 [Dolichospermum sp. DET67]|nr:hypothetical protein [Dolichospermum sp. DET67]
MGGVFVLHKNHAKIVVENLCVSGMLANHKLAQVIADCGFHEFKRQLEFDTLTGFSR